MRCAHCHHHWKAVHPIKHNGRDKVLFHKHHRRDKAKWQQMIMMLGKLITFEECTIKKSNKQPVEIISE